MEKTQKNIYPPSFELNILLQSSWDWLGSEKKLSLCAAATHQVYMYVFNCIFPPLPPLCRSHLLQGIMHYHMGFTIFHSCWTPNAFGPNVSFFSLKLLITCFQSSLMLCAIPQGMDHVKPIHSCDIHMLLFFTCFALFWFCFGFFFFAFTWLIISSSITLRF